MATDPKTGAGLDVVLLIEAGERAVRLIRQAIRDAEDGAFDGTVDARAAEGWANPTLQAQNEWQGHDNGVVFGTFAEAVDDLGQYGDVPTGCDGPDEDTDPAEHLERALATAGEVGTGRPVAYVGVDGYFTLVRETATPDEIAGVAVDCLPADDEDVSETP
jgi:hypothetical protein